MDPAVFANISAIHVFSASGDQQGVARLKGPHADVVFGSNSGGIGRLPNFPVAEVSVTVLATAVPGATGAVTLQSSSPWREASGKQYTVSFQSPGVAISAGMSIQSVAPGGGPIPAGTVVAINGQGFTSSTKLQLDGVAWTGLQFVSSSLLNITLTGPIDLAGKLFQLTDARGAATRYYSNLTPVSMQEDIPNSGYWPIFPTATYQAGNAGYYLWLENDTLDAIDIVISPIPVLCTPCAGPPLYPKKKITLVGGGVYLVYYPYSSAGYYPAQGSTFTASAPIRVLQGLPPSLGQLPELSSTALSPNSSIGWAGCGTTRSIDYRVGDPPPPPLSCGVSVNPPPSSETLTAGTDDGNPWLQASAVPGSTTNFTVSMNPAGLTLGSHSAVVTAVLEGGPARFVQAPVTLNVHADGTISADASGVSFDISSPSSVTFRVTSTSPSVPFTVSSSDSWFTITPTNGTTPATLTASVAPSTPPDKNATLTIRGPGNILTLPVWTYALGRLSNPIAFAAKAGTTSVMTSGVYVSTASPFMLKVATDSGGTWLSAVVSSQSGPAALTVQVDPTGLTAGLYHGTVTATPTNSTFGSSLLVTLTVWTDPLPPLVASPASLEFQFPSQQLDLHVSAGSLTLPFSVYPAGDGISLSIFGTETTPESLTIQAFAPPYPGTYHGSVTVTAPPGSANSVIVPVTVTALATPVVDLTRPKISAIVNAGSLLPGALAPGEIVSVFGLVSSPGTAGLNIGSDGKVNREHYGIRVLFNGIAAPLTYVSAAQINAVVPYEIANSPIVTVEIDGGGVHSAPWSVPVTPSAPGLFTQNGTGQKDGAILNQDNSLNAPENPALRGSIVQIFLTGEGATNPPGVTGEVTRSETKSPAQAVTVQIGGVDAKVISATTAPDALAGLFQINALVPAGSPTGSLQVLVRIGNGLSQSTATLSVQ